MLAKGVLQQFVEGAGTGRGAQEVDIVQVGQDSLTWLEALVGLVESGGNRRGEQPRHERVSLLAAFVLEDAVPWGVLLASYQTYSEGVL